MRLVLCAVYLFMGAVLFAIPNLTRRELLFAVPVPPDFRESRAGRQAISRFRAAVAAAVLGGECLLLWSPAGFLHAAAAAVPFALLLTGGIVFYRQHRRLAPAAAQFTPRREAELTAAPEELPRFVWLAAGPYAMLAAAAVWLYLNWELIPARFPVHFDAAGQPNRWAERTTKGVFGPLIFGAELCAWLLIMGLAGWFGSRRSRFRSVMLGGMVAIGYLLGLLFTLIALQPALGIPVWLVAVSPIAILLPFIAIMIHKMNAAAEPMDPTPNECWKGAIFYYNPDDAAVFVEKREGFGYTFNFANPWSWVLLLGLGLVIASAKLVLA